MVSVGIGKNIGNAKVSQRELEETKLELEKICELYLNMMEENKVHCRQNGELAGQLGAVTVKNDELSQEVVAERERKEALDADMKNMEDKHKAIMNQIVEEHKAAMARLEQKNAKALEEFKRETLETVNNITQ